MSGSFVRSRSKWLGGCRLNEKTVSGHEEQKEMVSLPDAAGKTVPSNCKLSCAASESSLKLTNVPAAHAVDCKGTPW